VVPFSSEFFSCLSFTFSMTVEIFMYCWFGNEVEVKVLLTLLEIFFFLILVSRVATLCTPFLNPIGWTLRWKSRRI
jgi:hypothetical protein